MKTGYAKVCISPPVGTPVQGYYEKRFTKGILDDIYARAVAFDDGMTRAVVIALDLCFLQDTFFEEIKEAITAETGIQKEAVFINCSHTHTGPVVGEEALLDKKEMSFYDKFLLFAIRDAAIYALQDLSDSKVEMAESEAKNISFVRRYRMKDGSVATNPGVLNENIDYPLGTPNETVKVIKIVREGKDDICVVNFGTHVDTVGGEYISADFPGYACSILENAIPNTKCMFLQGVEGDVNHVNVNPTKGERAISEIDFDSVPRSNRHAEHMGRRIAGAVLSVYSITEEVKTDKISCASKIVRLPSNQENDRLEEAREIYECHKKGLSHTLPYKEMELTTVVAEASRIIKLENGPEYFEMLLSVIKIGDLVFAGIGGEPFTEIGNRIFENSPFKNMILCALTNSPGDYIPTGKAYDEGGYEAKSSNMKRGCDDILVQGMTELLQSL